MGRHVGSGGKPLWSIPGSTLAEGVDDPGHWDVWADGKGGLGIVCVQSRHVVMRHVPSDGPPLRADIPTGVNVSTAAQNLPSGAPDVAGGAFLVWSERLLPNRSVLMGQHLDVNGRPLWSSVG